MATFRLPATLLRRVDEAIAESDTAYADRSEYAADALWDKLARDGVTRDRVPARGSGGRGGLAVELDVPHEDLPFEIEAGLTPGLSGRVVEDVLALGAWSSEDVPTIPVEPHNGVSFGLHNRDLPSLFALDRLCRIAVDRRGPTPWSEYIASLRPAVAEASRLLRRAEGPKPSGTRASVGFPKQENGLSKSFDRFVSAFVGNGMDGPLVMLGLAAPVRDLDRAMLPTDAGVSVLRSIISAGVDGRLPHTARAAELWWAHVERNCPDEHSAWRRMLVAAGRRPSRQGLVASFPEWVGSLADTNVMGLVSRSREWGLLEPELVDRHYHLTLLGSRAREDFHA
jgi:hypothetical protein